jgi:hypothetical protein
VADLVNQCDSLVLWLKRASGHCCVKDGAAVHARVYLIFPGKIGVASFATEVAHYINVQVRRTTLVKDILHSLLVAAVRPCRIDGPINTRQSEGGADRSESLVQNLGLDLDQTVLRWH